MSIWTIAMNDKTTMYEVHAEGCKHLMSKHLLTMTSEEASSGAEAAEIYEASNEGCLTVLGPCAKGGKS